MPQCEAVFPAASERHALYEAHGYSAAIKSGDLLFVSGQVGSRLDGSPEPDFKKQVELAFENLSNVLKAAGCTFDDIIDVTTFHTDPENQFDAIQVARELNRPIVAARMLAEKGSDAAAAQAFVDANPSLTGCKDIPAGELTRQLGDMGTL